MRARTKLMALALALGGCTSAAGATDAGDPDAARSPAPATCTITPARPLGGTTNAIGALPIQHTPEGELLGAATVTSLDITADPMVLVLDVSGVSHRLEVPAWREPPAVGAGQTVWVALVGTASSPTTTSLVLRESETGPAIAAYVRGRGHGFTENVDVIATAFGITLTSRPVCRLDTGGQCGRGVIVRALASGDGSATEGQTMLVARTGARSVGISVGAFSDDNDAWAPGEVCAIGPLIAQSFDAIVEPPGD